METRSNTPYPGKAIRRIQATWEYNILEDIKHSPYSKKPPIHHIQHFGYAQTSSLKSYVPSVILEKIIIDLEDEVKKKGSSNTSNVNLSSVSHSKLNKDVKRYSRKYLLSYNNSHLGETSSAYVCNDAMNVSCNSRLCDSFDENNLFIFDDESIRISPVSKMTFRKKPSDSMNVHSKSNSIKSLPRIVHMWLPKMRDQVPYQLCDHICKSYRFKNGGTKWPTCTFDIDGFYNGGELPGMVRVGSMTYFQDHRWYDKLADGKLKDETLALKTKIKGSWGDANPEVIKFCRWLKSCFENFHELKYEVLVKLQECWWKVNAHEIAPFTRMENFGRGPYANIKTKWDNNIYLDINRKFEKSNTGCTQENQENGDPIPEPSNCKVREFEMMNSHSMITRSKFP
nr:hypothetical protein [Tanacetum cinerariifolium]